jgi:GNAT superfamily N-acetyltransferase
MISIRSAGSADVPALARLLGQLFAEEAEFTPDVETQARGLAMIVADPAAGRILVADEEGRAIGMVSLLYTISTALGARVAILEDMVIDRDCRGSGIGGKLLAGAIEAARADGARRITLLTDHDNIRAHGFYSAFGFERSAMVPFRLVLAGTLPA